MSMIFAVIPVFNEDPKTVRSLVKRSLKFVDRVIIVDDGSDRPLNKGIFRKVDLPRTELIRHVVNRGVGAATVTGFEYALSYKNMKVVVTLDGDGQHSPEDIPKVLKPVVNGEADVVIGSRTLQSWRGMPIMNQIGNRLINYIVNLRYGLHITDSQSGFRAFNRKALELIEAKIDKYGFCAEIIGELKRKNLVLKEVGIKLIYTNKYKGTNMYDGAKILFDLVLRRIT